MKKNDALLIKGHRIDPAADAFEGLAGSPEAEETLRAILSSPAPKSTGDRVPRARTQQHPRPRWGAVARRTLAVGVVAAVVLAITVLGPADRPDPTPKRVWATELVSIAAGAPRLLLDEDQWRVYRVDEFSADTGEMTFENGRDCSLLPLKEGCYWVDLHWRPEKTHTHYFQDRKRGSDASSKISIDGHEATVFEYRNTVFGKTYHAMWLDGPHSLELRTDLVPTLAEFTAIAATLHSVDTDTWLKAMPASVVKPDERNEAIDRIAAGMPIPGNVDLETLKDVEKVSQDISLEYEVGTVVVCGWIQQWVDGTKADDERAVAEAIRALSWNGWHERYSGQWFSYLEDVAVAMKTGSRIYDDQSVPAGVQYQRTFGCEEG